MPLQNRVTPTGELIATPGRGLFMGNRGGQFHRADKTLSGRRWASKAWITCLIEWQGRRETVWADRHYTQLFFLDEATALAAGHRPCALCRRADYERFRQAWMRAHRVTQAPTAHAMDEELHRWRLAPDRSKRVTELGPDGLPDGTFVLVARTPHLLLGGALLAWSPGSYGAPIAWPEPRPVLVRVLTPLSILGVLTAGYEPVLHPSATVAH